LIHQAISSKISHKKSDFLSTGRISVGLSSLKGLWVHEMNSTMRLSIGSGLAKREGWITLDADPRSDADIIATIPPFPDLILARQWHEIEMIHIIEHFYRWEVEEVLRSIHSMLAPGGILVLEQPNILFAAKVILGLLPPVPGTASGQCDMWPLYGDPSHKNPLYCHHWAYAPHTLIRLLVECGFEENRIIERPAKSHIPIRDFRLEAQKEN
jgi:hypothetical protein